MLNFLKNLLINRAPLITCYILNTFFLILFFNLDNRSSREVLYPITISLVVFLILIFIEVIRNYNFQKSLPHVVENINYDLQPGTGEQKEIAKYFKAIHQKYTSHINTINQANQKKQHLLSQWIHNLKTPITVMDLILNQGDLKPVHAQEVLVSLKEENLRLRESVEKMLNLIRLEEFSRDYTPEAVDLVKSLKKIINNRKNQFIYNAVYPKLNIQDSSVLVISDEKWNELMLEQIISNAIKYSAGNQSTIEFSVESTETTTILIIKDRGIGIPSYDLTRIYEPFFTGENGRKFTEATGIGLYICGSLAEKLGHSLNITSKVNHGTEVRITYLAKR